LNRCFCVKKNLKEKRQLATEGRARRLEEEVYKNSLKISVILDSTLWFTSTEKFGGLKARGRSVAELRELDMNALVYYLSEGGFSWQELKEGGSTAKELRTVLMYI
jgi:hypothetical protein